MRSGSLLRLLLASLLASGAWGCARARAERAEAPARPARSAGDSAPAPLVLTGELTAARSAALSVPETNVWMVAIRWMESDGALVKKGQKVAEFDNASLAATLEEKRIARTEAETERTRAAAESEVTRSEKLLALEERRVALEKARLDAAIPEELRSRREHEEKQMAKERAEVELRKAESDLDAASETARAEASIRELALSRATSELEAAERGIAALTLLAPEDGAVLVGENPRERRKIQTGDTLWPGVVIARVAQTTALQAEAVLHDVDDGRMSPGDRVLLVPDAFPARRLDGTVTDVTAVAQELSNESPRRAFKVLIKIVGGPVEGLRPGLSVKVKLGGDEGEAAEGAAAALLPKPANETVSVKRETFVSAVELKGTLQALDSEPLGPPTVADLWEYRITTMAPEGSTVKKGQRVLAFDTTTLTQRLEEKRAEAESAAKQIEKRERDLALRREEIAQRTAEAEARRKKAVLKADIPEALSSAIELKKAKLDLALAVRQMEVLAEESAAAARAAEAELSILANRRDKARVRVREIEDVMPKMAIASPRDGMVVYVTNWRDEKKKVGDVCWRVEKVLDVPDVSRLGVAAEVDEADSGRVAVGQRVSVRLDANPDQEYGGTVTTIRRNIQRASAKNALKVARLDVTLDRVDGRMRPGMRVRGRVEIERVPGALVIPADCVLLTEKGPAVFRRSGGSVKTVPITPGRRSGERVEVRSGLSEGDLLVKPESGS